MKREERNPLVPAEHSSPVDPEVLWRELGLPGKPAFVRDKAALLISEPNAELLKSLRETRRVIQERSQVEKFPEPPDLLEAVGFSGTQVPFNDKDPSPPVDYMLIHRFVIRETSPEESSLVVRNLVFRDWWRVSLLIENFEHTVERLSK